MGSLPSPDTVIEYGKEWESRLTLHLAGTLERGRWP